MSALNDLLDEEFDISDISTAALIPGSIKKKLGDFMKLALDLVSIVVGFTLNSVAASDAAYDMSGSGACVLQITKESSPNLVVACGVTTEVNNPIQAYSEMKDVAAF